ncbi:GntR family transcriptional regulator [Agrobacterium albertimagni AOL15]|uniref:Histidine utilization repressor n=2 Tax=Agrobacterium albertimagni TaxID=147266 RepID=K2Q666_9HYPH|nr:histidine utilization repressor [Agrobacterium albertimagni]EKF60720.1 GntR family transcriptional regulator [Agrobacterium albertimagni AOL15]
MSDDQPGFALPEERQDTPLYEQMKAEIKARIERGDWPINFRIPSENELVEMLGVSRMTAHRALRELASEGVIVRVQGRGSFVAPKKRRANVSDVRNIAEEIAERGGQHSVEIVLMQAEVCDHDLADRLEVETGTSALHSVIVHKEDDLPIQLEDRFVHAELAPAYLDQDFRAITPNAYLSGIAPISRAEQFVEAVLPQPWECRLLAIARSEPCLLVRRRTWSGDRLVTSVRLLYPGSRYSLESSY